METVIVVDPNGVAQVLSEKEYDELTHVLIEKNSVTIKHLGRPVNREIKKKGEIR